MFTHNWTNDKYHFGLMLEVLELSKRTCSHVNEQIINIAMFEALLCHCYTVQHLLCIPTHSITSPGVCPIMQLMLQDHIIPTLC